MNTFTLQMPAYIKPSTFIVNKATYLCRSCAGGGETRGGEKVPNKSAAAASWNLLHHPSTVWIPSPPIDLRFSSEGPKRLEFDVTADWHSHTGEIVRLLEKEANGAESFQRW